MISVARRIASSRVTASRVRLPGTSGGGADYDPTSTFASSDGRFFLGPVSRQWSDEAGTTLQATADGVIGKLEDISGCGNHATQNNSANKLIRRVADGKVFWSGGLVDGTVRFAETPTVALAAMTHIMVFKIVADGTADLYYMEASPGLPAGRHLFYSAGTLQAYPGPEILGGSPGSVFTYMRTDDPDAIGEGTVHYLKDGLSFTGMTDNSAGYTAFATPTNTKLFGYPGSSSVEVRFLAEYVNTRLIDAGERTALFAYILSQGAGWAG